MFSVCNVSFFFSRFKVFHSIFSFQQFEYDLTTCGFLCIYLGFLCIYLCDLMKFLIYVCFSLNLRKLRYFIEYFFCPILSSRFLGLKLCMCYSAWYYPTGNWGFVLYFSLFFLCSSHLKMSIDLPSHAVIHSSAAFYLPLFLSSKFFISYVLLFIPRIFDDFKMTIYYFKSLNIFIISTLINLPVISHLDHLGFYTYWLFFKSLLWITSSCFFDNGSYFPASLHVRLFYWLLDILDDVGCLSRVIFPSSYDGCWVLFGQHFNFQ